MFCEKCGKETADGQAFCASCGAPLAQAASPEQPGSPGGFGAFAGPAAPGVAAGISPKSRLATTLLAWFLGIFGAHRFYIGKTGTAVVMLVLGIVGIATSWLLIGFIPLVAVEIWALVDFIFAIVGKMQDSQGLLIEKW